MKRILLLMTALGAAGVWAAERPTYTLGTPSPAALNMTSDVTQNAWLASNDVFVVTAGFMTEDGESRREVAESRRFQLAEAEVGFSWERSKPEYYLSDRLEAPGEVDWNATYAHYLELQASNEELGFLFNPNKLDPCVYAIAGGNQSFEWIYKDGTTNKMTYVVAMSYNGRPRRVYWTDSPYNGPKISLAGKFVRFMGNDELLTLRHATVTNIVGGVTQVQENKVVSGLYVDKDSQVLYAAGELSGQCVMVYYDTGSYENILCMQVVEVRKPEANELKGTIGEALRPDGQGYPTEGLVAQISTGVGDSTDTRGDYLYQHAGNYSYSKKNRDVFPLRPTVGARWLASVYWMESDAMGVQWPFEYDQYENDWPEEGQLYVRGDAKGADGAVDYGAKIFIDTAYAASLEKFQEPEGHARAVGGDNSFYTTGPGWSLLRLAADDNIWFLPVHSISRSDTNYFTLASSRVTVGRELALRSGTRSGTAHGQLFACDPSLPGYIYKAVSGTQYDAELYHEQTGSTNTTETASTTNRTSAIYAIAAGKDRNQRETIEVWWNEKAELDEDAPAPISVPVLPQVYRPVWPEADEMPQIVIASQQGSANETIYQQNGAAYFDAEQACLFLAERRYFPAGEGTISFWTRPAAHADDTLQVTNAPSALLSFGWAEAKGEDDGVLFVDMTLAIEEDETLVLRTHGEVLLSAVMPKLATVNDWTHIAVAFDKSGARLILDGEVADEYTGDALSESLAEFLDGGLLGANFYSDPFVPVSVGREVAELVLRSRAQTAEEVASSRYEVLTGGEANVTGYYTFRQGVDLRSQFQSADFAFNACVERVHGETCQSLDLVYIEPGAPARGSGVIVSDTEPVIYRQNDSTAPGYNPNEEHAFLRTGSGGYVAWALRTDLGTDDTPPPAVFVEYSEGERARLQMFSVVLTNDTWRTLGADCTAGTVLPGPHPIDLFDTPWFAQDYWETQTNGLLGVAYRDRKGQIWSRAAGELKMHMYYPMQDGFDFPQLTAAQLPAVGTPIPWLALLDEAVGQDMNPLSAEPAAWTWSVAWPKDVPTMKIGQTLTKPINGLPEVWGAKSLAVIYPDKDSEKTALLTDPTVIQSVEFAFKNLATLGLTTDKNGGLAERNGKYYFTDLPPHLSNRLYLDGTNDKLCFLGELTSSAAGASILYPNVLSATERSQVKNLVASDMATSQAEAYKAWTAAVDKLATSAVRPNTAKVVNGEIKTEYRPIDHYGLAAMGGTNYVTLIENDATNDVMAVSAGDPINMHIVRVVPEYYTGRIVTREDEVNLLSQQLSVLYTEAFLGEADDYVFEWRHAAPLSNGRVPSAYDDTSVYQRKYDPDKDSKAVGNVRITVGEQGDTLANMVNTYWICRYRAKDKSSPAYPVMGLAWSEWCAPPALAEGWVQRVLNNITPFNQRMTDLYENAVETPISMIQIAGKPYTGDVALNQDNMTSVGLIELYETILNKAESLSLQLGINDEGANKQLLLAVERLQDLYVLLGDEAYTDAKNPTISVGSNKAFGGDNQPEVDMDNLSSALFCFDNQVPSLLDEELALLRGRSGESAPETTTAPYYNRLVWNFTKGITAGEVAYAVNYNIEGQETTVLGEEQAARLYPQGHGDAYGHYLSALKGWYRLLRNPNFSWPVAQGEMVVADSTVNVDYYEESKFAIAAAKVAKVAADCADLTARKACRDNGGSTSSGYLDAKPERAFGYGEWASRGGYGALVNWVAANSLLPAGVSSEDEAFDAAFDDPGLTRIDRTTVEELADICSSAAAVQRKLDELDAGMNPLGLSDRAVPFDIAPSDAADGATHYEQVRERAAKALGNARTVLNRAQEYSNRLRLLQESADSYEDTIAAEEATFTKELIGYYGTPYSDDIGPGKTYAQGYEGPDLVHYTWMDLSKFGLTSVDDAIAKRGVKYSGIASRTEIATIKSQLDSGKVETDFAYEMSASGLVVKPSNITGSRQTQGSIQEKYAEFLLQYVETKNAITAYDNAVDNMDVQYAYSSWMTGCETVLFVAREALNTYRTAKIIMDSSLTETLNTLDYMKEIGQDTFDAVADSAPRITGAGMTVNVDPSALVKAALAPEEVTYEVALASAKLTAQSVMETMSLLEKQFENAISIAETTVSYYATLRSLANDYKASISEVNSAYNEMQLAISKLNVCVEAFNAEVAKGQTCLQEREAARKVHANRVQQARYNDMFFRLQRNETLARYAQSFGLAQKYAFLAAQAYDYETALLSSDPAAGDAFKAKILGARSLGAFDEDGNPILADAGDTGLAGALAQMDANWLVLKPRLGINNPQNYATWFSLRRECFRILPDEDGDEAWAKELSKHWVDDIKTDPLFVRHCQPFQSQFGLQDKEPGLIIPFETTIDFAKNLFGQDLAGGDASYDSTWFATRIAAAGLWFDGYNGKEEGYKGNPLLANTPVAYLVPVGKDCMRVPGLDDGRILQFSVEDQVVPAPYEVGSSHLDDASWTPSMLDGDYAGADSAAKIRRHPSFRAYFNTEGGDPDDDKLDATRLVGRSVWNTKWILVIPGGGMNADREKALSIFINGSDQDRDGKRDLTPVSDIRIGFKTYSHSGN